MKTIVIDGEEFVLVPKDKLDSSLNIEEKLEIEIDNFFYGCVAEDKNHCFEFSILMDQNEDGELEVCSLDGMASVEWTYKKGSRSEWKTELLDNPDWLRKIDVLPKSHIEEFPKEITGDSYLLLRALITKMKEIKWL